MTRPPLPLRAARLAARSKDIVVDWNKSAMIVIDMQNDFGSPGGMFDRAGIPIAGIQSATTHTAAFLEAARAAGRGGTT